MEKQYSAAYWKEQLNLETHVEGGAFKEMYRSETVLPQSVLSNEHKGDRNTSTSIYFLLEYGEFSAFHRIASDELWHFYDGAGLTVYEIEESGTLVIHKLGKDVASGEFPQAVIKAGSWFASRVEHEGGYALCGCTVAPGFDFADFELADRNKLSESYPEHSSLIAELTH
ncbi:MAG: cupin domain-containing protein [Chitinophagales bacterium]|nr:cupin domain-containing protein [Chitinophagaceae bacterium]MCB9064534.1 cupin domain-containing protein [Chitinophagales bacterium]